MWDLQIGHVWKPKKQFKSVDGTVLEEHLECPVHVYWRKSKSLRGTLDFLDRRMRRLRMKYNKW